jgi:hypothetical protein
MVTQVHPLLILVISFPILFISGWIGAVWRERQPDEDGRDDFEFVMGASLTLLGLIVAFTFSMAVSRYDLRKNYEEQEANAIGTEYVRAALLSDPDAANVRRLLTSYLDQRLIYYTTADDEQLRKTGEETARLQSQLWSAVAVPAKAEPTPVMALVLAGMNDVLNSQGYTQAAFWNRIPIGAWALLIATSIFCNFLVGYSGGRRKGSFRLLILPVTLSIALFLIADIDSPRRGVVRVRPQNLESLAESLPTTR